MSIEMNSSDINSQPKSMSKAAPIVLTARVHIGT